MLTERVTEEIIKSVFFDNMPVEHINREEISKEFTEPINVVDENDNIIGLEYKGICHTLGLRHETVFVLMISPDDRMLLEKKREALQDVLDLPVTGHVGTNEDAGACVTRKMTQKFDFNPEVGRLKIIDSFNRDCPLSLSNPHLINKERRFLFKYFVTNPEMAKLKDCNATLDWYDKKDIVDAINVNKTTDELLMSFIHYLVYKLPGSEIRIG